jgi:hypothetical protein
MIMIMMMIMMTMTMIYGGLICFWMMYDDDWHYSTFLVASQDMPMTVIWFVIWVCLTIRYPQIPMFYHHVPILIAISLAPTILRHIIEFVVSLSIPFPTSATGCCRHLLPRFYGAISLLRRSTGWGKSFANDPYGPKSWNIQATGYLVQPLENVARMHVLY